jgi:hypothetical protein
MKKLFLTLALTVLSLTAAHAQFGVIGGFTSSTTKIAPGTNWSAEIQKAPLWHAGVAYKIGMGPFFTLQPQLTYQTKGSGVKDAARNLKSQAGFVELGLGAQLGLDLLIVRPYLLLEPFIGYDVTPGERFSGDLAGISLTNDQINQYLKDARNKFEVGFGIGGGIEVMRHVQVSVQWFMNVGKLYSEDRLAADAVLKTFTANYKDLKNYQGLKVTVGIFF